MASFDSPTPPSGLDGVSGAPLYPSSDYYHQLATQEDSLPSLVPPDTLNAPSWPWVTAVRGVFMRFLSPISILVSIWAWGAYFGSWTFGVVFAGLILVHEMGHFIAYKLKGVRVQWPVLVPLFGGFVVAYGAVPKVRDRAEAALAGPALGGIGAIFCLFMASHEASATCGVSLFSSGPSTVNLCLYMSNTSFWLSLARLGFFLNLINLVPINPLDGGRVAGAISRWLWPVGLVLGAGLLALDALNGGTVSLFFIVLIGLGLFETVTNFRQAPESAYFSISVGVRVYITVIYALTAALLAIGMLMSTHLLEVFRFVRP